MLLFPNTRNTLSFLYDTLKYLLSTTATTSDQYQPNRETGLSFCSVSAGQSDPAVGDSAGGECEMALLCDGG